MKDWINQNEADPRMPTDPDYVELNALAENYSASRDSLIQFAIKNPRAARQSGGNPWTENDGDEALFLHEPSVANHFRQIGK